MPKKVGCLPFIAAFTDYISSYREMIGFFHNLSHFFERGIRSTSTAGIHTAPTHCLQVVVLEAISGTIQQEAVPLTTQQKQQEE